MIKISANSIMSGLPEDLQALAIYESENQKNSVRLIAVGDIGFSGGIRKWYGENRNYEDIFSNVRAFQNSGDLLFGNLETPLVKNSSSSQQFAGDPGAISGLKSIGFNLLHLANNHALDYGLSGLSFTIDQLRLNNIIPLGVGAAKDEAKRLVKTNIKGIRIGWLACGHTMIDQKDGVPVFWEFNETELIDEVKTSRSQVDVLIVSIHTGLMYLDYPKPELKTFIEQLFDSGVNLVLMHHAHVLQSVQIHSGGEVCCYNLGNFIFDWQEGNVKVDLMKKEQNESAVFVFDIGKKGIIQAAAIPVFLDKNYKIHWAEGNPGQAILDRLENISNAINFDYSEEFDQQRALRNSGPIIDVIIFHFKKGNWKYIWGLLTHLKFEHIKMLWTYSIHQISGRIANHKTK